MNSMTENDANIRIVIADDHPLLLQGLKYLIGEEEGLMVIGEASDGKTALELIINLQADIAILDIDMPKLNGIEVLEILRDEKIPTKVIIFTMHNESAIFRKAVNLQVNGFLLKDSVNSEILQAIRTVIRNEKYYDPVLSGGLLDNIISNPMLSRLENLTKTEKNILQFVSQNKTTSQIAQHLFISERTVDRHRSNICSKLGISGHNALIRFVIANKEFLN